MHKYESLSQKISMLIEEQIALGQERLPTEATLCRMYSVSRQTLRRSMDELVRRGLIERRQGSGSYITGLYPSHKQNQAAILVCHDLDYHYPELLDRLRARIPEGYDTSLFLSDYSIRREREILTSLLASPPRVLYLEAIASALPSPNESVLAQLLEKGTELSFLGDAYPGFEIYAREYADSSNAVSQITAKLFALGQSQIACILPMDQVSGQTAGRDFLRTCFETLSDREVCGYEPEKQVFWYTNDDLLMLRKKQDLSFLTDIVDRMLSSCSVIICYSDEIAYWLVRVLRMKNHSMRELTVISLNHTRLSDSTLRFEFRPEFSWSTADRFLKDKAEIV